MLAGLTSSNLESCHRILHLKAAVIATRAWLKTTQAFVGVHRSDLQREKRRQCARSAAGSGARVKCNNEVLIAVRARQAWRCSREDLEQQQAVVVKVALLHSISRAIDQIVLGRETAAILSATWL